MKNTLKGWMVDNTDNKDDKIQGIKSDVMYIFKTKDMKTKLKEGTATKSKQTFPPIKGNTLLRSEETLSYK